MTGLQLKAFFFNRIWCLIDQYRTKKCCPADCPDCAAFFTIERTASAQLAVENPAVFCGKTYILLSFSSCLILLWCRTVLYLGLIYFLMNKEGLRSALFGNKC